MDVTLSDEDKTRLIDRVGVNVVELATVLSAEPLSFQALSVHLMLWPLLLAAIGFVAWGLFLPFIFLAG